MSEEQKEQARKFFQAANKLPKELQGGAALYLEGMTAAAKLMKEGMENKTA